MEPAMTLVIDFPWLFKDSLPGKGRGSVKHYPCLSLEEGLALPLPPVADDCRLFFWRVASMQREALTLIEAYGFGAPKSELVWCKTRKGVEEAHEVEDLTFGMGNDVRNCHEVCLIAKRGRPERLDAGVRSVFFAPRGEHSQKPDAFYELVERLSPPPYTELFARRQRPGWTCLGDELDGRDLRKGA